VGSLKLVTCINEICGCSPDVDLIVSQEATCSLKCGPYACIKHRE